MTGRQLGEASHRLVVNSLQLKGEHNGYGNHMYPPPQPYPAAPFAQSPLAYQDYRGDQRMMQQPVPPYGYDQHHQYMPADRRSQPHYNRHNQPPPVAVSQNGGPRYMPRPMPQARDLYPSHRCAYRPPGGGNFQQWGNGNAPRGYGHHQDGVDLDHQPYNNQSRGNYGQYQNNNNQQRGNQGQYQHHHNNQRGNHQSLHQQRNNQFSALDRKPNRRPPPPGNGN